MQYDDCEAVGKDLQECAIDEWRMVNDCNCNSVLRQGLVEYKYSLLW
jgi:hypothetical protein